MTRLFYYLAGLLLIASATGNDVRAGGQSSPISEQPTFTAEQIDFFETEVRPILTQHCYRCHSTDAMELKARLYLDSREGAVNGGESGAAIVVGKPDESLLISAVKYDGVMMPPDRKLDQRSVNALVKWVEMGAPWPEVTSSPGERTSVTGRTGKLSTGPRREGSTGRGSRYSVQRFRLLKVIKHPLRASIPSTVS